MVDTLNINTSRDYDCCRYFELIKRIERFYADNIITDEELGAMNEMRGETLINYQVAAEMLHQMKPEAKDYVKMTEFTSLLANDGLCHSKRKYSKSNKYYKRKNAHA